MNWNTDVRLALRQARLDSGISVIEMAVIVGRDHRTLRRIESGDVEPRGEIIDTWMKACKKRLSVKVEDI